MPKVDQEKAHLWIAGLNQANCIVYIKRVSLGSPKRTAADPINVFRVAILKHATQIIVVHNHSSGSLKPFKENNREKAKEQTGTLAQTLLEKGVKIESIAKALEVTPGDIEKLLKRKSPLSLLPFFF